MLVPHREEQFCGVKVKERGSKLCGSCGGNGEKGCLSLQYIGEGEDVLFPAQCSPCECEREVAACNACDLAE